MSLKGLGTVLLDVTRCRICNCSRICPIEAPLACWYVDDMITSHRSLTVIYSVELLQLLKAAAALVHYVIFEDVTNGKEIMGLLPGT